MAATKEEYKRNELYFLEPISHERDISKQIIEIDRRMNLFWQQREESKLPIMPVHIRAVLGLNKETYSEYLEGKVKTRVVSQGSTVKDKLIKVEPEAAYDDENKVLLIRQRSDLLAKWAVLAETTILDTATNPDYKGGQTGSIKMAEYLGYKQADQLELQVKADDYITQLAAWKQKQDKAKAQ